MRTAAVAQPVQIAPAATAAAPRSRNVAAGGGAGAYAVQISSQRSEAEAQAAFRGLQGKFPSQLGGRQPLIHRVDLGAKGIYFRAMVGPFANANEAGELCSSLKAAGGSCLVQKN
jgi:cell division septation protein DedD